MYENVIKEDMARVCSANGIEVYKIETRKFKTNTINIFFLDNLEKEKASMNAMVPAVLRRGCKRFPSFKDIALYLEELYGASFDCGVTKKGELQVIQFYIEFVSDNYIGQSTNLFEKAFELIYELVTEPVVENGSFKQEYVRQEKDNLKRLIESRINDKVQYSVEKCFEEMCNNEPFGVYDYGTVEDVEYIEANNLYKHYVNMVETFPVKVFITGDVEEQKLKSAINKLLSIKRGKIKRLNETQFLKQVKDVRDITEKMDVNQSKLSLGYRTNTPPYGGDYYKLVVYNGILGGGIHSKLFQNVREKESLAYYIFSRIEKFKGLLIISSGIEGQNREKTEEIILKQMEDLKKGNISDYEYDSTIKTIETGIKSLKDSQIQMVDFYLSQIITGSEEGFQSLIESVKKVTREDVINTAPNIKLDTKFFLTSL